MSALSLSRDRSIVAYCGSGGEVGVLRFADRKSIFEQKRDGSHWACALSADGAKLYLGDKDGILVLDPWTGSALPLTKMDKPRELDLTPDGKRLAVATWGIPLAALDANAGKELWRHQGQKPSCIGFSPCGRWLATAGPARKGAAATLTCFDAATFGQLWSVPLGSGSDSACFAFSPDGEELLAASSASKRMPTDGTYQATAPSPSSQPRAGRNCATSRGAEGSTALRFHRAARASPSARGSTSSC